MKQPRPPVDGTPTDGAGSFRFPIPAAQGDERQPVVSAAQRMVGFTRLRLGEFIRAREHLEEALKIYNAQ
jgi:hypothetical protein